MGCEQVTNMLVFLGALDFNNGGQDLNDWIRQVTLLSRFNGAKL